MNIRFFKNLCFIVFLVIIPIFFWLKYFYFPVQEVVEVKEAVENIVFASVEDLKEYNKLVKSVNSLMEGLFGKEKVTKYSIFYKELPLDTKIPISEYKELYYKLSGVLEFFYNFILNTQTKR